MFHQDHCHVPMATFDNVPQGGVVRMVHVRSGLEQERADPAVTQAGGDTKRVRICVWIGPRLQKLSDYSLIVSLSCSNVKRSGWIQCMPLHD